MPLTEAELAEAKALLSKAMAILEGQTAEQIRNPEWFRDTGRLTDAGIRHAEAMFEAGKTPYAVQKEMGISYRAAAERQKSWKKRRL